MLLHVQRSGDSGSPRVTGSTNRSKSSRRLASLLTVCLRPPPFRRIRPVLAPPLSCSSLIPWLMALRQIPGARETAEIPPHPLPPPPLPATTRPLLPFHSPPPTST